MNNQEKEENVLNKELHKHFLVSQRSNNYIVRCGVLFFEIQWYDDQYCLDDEDEVRYREDECDVETNYQDLEYAEDSCRRDDYMGNCQLFQKFEAEQFEGEGGDYGYVKVLLKGLCLTSLDMTGLWRRISDQILWIYFVVLKTTI